ncbi:MAG TPA: hypothetical protein VFP97_05070 [Chitinophagaceae bacterium]|nr:hypothetical protein [Chitinophagaceae bacterium]
MLRLASKIIAFITLIILFSSAVIEAQSNMKDQFKKITIDAGIAKKFKEAQKSSEFNIPKYDQGFWIFLSKDDFQFFLPAEESAFQHKLDTALFLDTLQTLIGLPCDCTIKADTIFLLGGLFYGGGIGIDLRIANNSFDAKVLRAGKGFRTDSASNFAEQITLNTSHQELRIQDPGSLKRGKHIVGQLTLITQDFYKKDEIAEDRIYMKILFRCTPDAYGPLN